MMHALYFDRDRKRGAKATLNWLKDEIEELSEALKENNSIAIECIIVRVNFFSLY